MKFLSSLAVVLIAFATAACGEEGGKPTGATCPQGSTLTYTNFGQQFMTDYCTRCHSSTATDRHGAPDDANFDTLNGVKAHSAHVDEEAGSGPDATNEGMPEDTDATNPAPTTAERAMLSEWIACGMPM